MNERPPSAELETGGEGRRGQPRSSFRLDVPQGECCKYLVSQDLKIARLPRWNEGSKQRF